MPSQPPQDAVARGSLEMVPAALRALAIREPAAFCRDPDRLTEAHEFFEGDLQSMRMLARKLKTIPT